MIITDPQLRELKLLAESALTDNDVVQIRAQCLIVALVKEAERVHLTGDSFSEGLYRSMLESLPFELQFFQTLSRFMYEDKRRQLKNV